MTAALEGGEWSAARPGRTLPPGKTRYPFYRKLCGPQGWSGRAEKSRPHRDFIRVLCIKYKSLNELLMGMSALFVRKLHLRHTTAYLPKVERGSRLISFRVSQLYPQIVTVIATGQPNYHVQYSREYCFHNTRLTDRQTNRKKNEVMKEV